MCKYFGRQVGEIARDILHERPREHHGGMDERGEQGVKSGALGAQSLEGLDGENDLVVFNG